MSEPMLKTSLPNGYRRKLAHVIVLLDGTELVTLRDAANALLDVFGSANARSGVPDNATRLLLMAAKTGKHHDIASATAAVQRVLTVAAGFAERNLRPGMLSVWALSVTAARITACYVLHSDCARDKQGLLQATRGQCVFRFHVGYRRAIDVREFMHEGRNGGPHPSIQREVADRYVPYRKLGRREPVESRIASRVPVNPNARIIPNVLERASAG